MPTTKEKPEKQDDKDGKIAFFFPTVNEGVTVFAHSKEEALLLVEDIINKS